MQYENAPFLESWDDYQALKSGEEKWQPKTECYISNGLRMLYHRPEIDMYFTETTQAIRPYLKLNDLINDVAACLTGKLTTEEHLLAKYKNRADAEFNAYRCHVLGYQVPDRFSQHTEVSPGLGFSSNFNFNTVLALSEVEGPTLLEALRDKEIDDDLRNRLAVAGKEECICVSLVNADHDRNYSNIIVSNRGTLQEPQFVHIDFEMVKPATNPQEVIQKTMAYRNPIDISWERISDRLILMAQRLQNCDDIAGTHRNRVECNLSNSIKYIKGAYLGG